MVHFPKHSHAAAFASTTDAYFRGLIDASGDCMWILTTDGVVKYSNAYGRALLGPAVGVKPAPLLSGLWPKECRLSLERSLAAAATGETQKFRAFFARPAPVYWETMTSPVMDDAGVVQEILVVSRNITHTVETQAFFESIIDLMPAPLIVEDARDGRLLLINQAAQELLGVGAEAAIGKTVHAFLRPAIAQAMAEMSRQVLQSGEMLSLREYRLTGPDGHTRYLDVKLLATHDDAGHRHLIGIGDDVTERRAAAVSLTAALKAAEQASEAKSAFMANMTHEIRTPLNGVIASAEMLAMVERDARSQELIAIIQTSGESLNALLSDILDIAGSDGIVIRAEPFHLGEGLRALMAAFAPMAEHKNLALSLDPLDDLEAICVGDWPRLRQVLSGLLSNALKFTDRGQVVVSAALTQPGRARFSVRDTGIGFDRDRKEHLFGEFQQADPSYTRRFDGAGLGLAIAKSLVERMGGLLDCDSQEGEGSIFWFEIPLQAQSPGRRRSIGAADEDAPPLRILLADDHPSNRQVIELMLADTAVVVSVQNGAEAVAAFADSAFDLVLMDMQMPVMDGLEAVRQLRRVEAQQGRPRTPISMLTANALPEHRLASAEAGADHHLGKPITVRTLFAMIEAALASELAA